MLRLPLRFFVQPLFLLLLMGCAFAQEIPKGLDDQIRAAGKKAPLAGLSVALVVEGKVSFARGYGFADRAAKRRVTAATPFLLASVSKTFTGVAAMQLVQAGKLRLDDDVNAHLPFRVRHPRFPKIPITLEMLMRHEAGIADNPDVCGEVYVKGKDSPLKLLPFLAGYFDPSSPHADANFLKTKPGSYDYSNIGIALLGAIVERVGGRSFAGHCREKIFKPLGLKSASWFLKTTDRKALATPYLLVGRKLEAQLHVGFPDYPNGQLRCSAADTARFLAAFMKGERLLSAKSRELMIERGLVWLVEGKGAGRIVSHAGEELGATTRVSFRPAKGVGVVLLTNTSGDEGEEEERIEKACDTIEALLYESAGVK